MSPTVSCKSNSPTAIRCTRRAQSSGWRKVILTLYGVSLRSACPPKRRPSRLRIFPTSVGSSKTSTPSSSKLTASQSEKPDTACVAPGYQDHTRLRPERSKYIGKQLRPFRAGTFCCFLPGATRSASLRACPWLSYSAPLALRLTGIRLLQSGTNVLTQQIYSRQIDDL